jgi:hypothetical protein
MEERRAFLKVLRKGEGGVKPNGLQTSPFYCIGLEIFKRGPEPQLPAWVRECFAFQSDA